MVSFHPCGCYYLIPIIQPWGNTTERRYLPLLSSSFHSTILSNTSRTVLTQKFTNSSTDNIKECIYNFPLYDGVSVVKFTAKVGNTILRGIVKEKFQAKKLFDEAVAKGETAGLLEQAPEASDVFSTKLGNVPAGESVLVETTYIGELKAGKNDGTRFTIPTRIAPRYGQGPSHSNYSLTSTQDAGGIKIVVDINIPDGSFIKGVQSPSHPIAVSMGTLSTAQLADPVMSKASATLALGSAELDKDFILIVQTKEAGLPKALLETHPYIPHQRAIMATLVPKFSLPPSRPEIVFVADRSGSMGGNIRMLISAMNVFLKSMPAGVKFNICSFGSHHSFLWQKSKSYDADSLAEASAHITTFSADMGGTETFSAVRATMERRWGDIPLEIMLLTDGDIWAQEQMFSYLNGEVEKSKGQIRVFPLGIGNGVSHALIEGVARAGNGFAQAVQNGEPLDGAVVRMLRGALSPHITDYSLEVKYETTDDDFEVIDTVTEGMRVLLNDPTPAEKSKISLFDSSAEPEKGEVTAGELDLPDIPIPKLLQAPHKIPSLFPFSRTSAYIILSPETFSRNPTSVIFKATSAHGPLELEIPIEVLPEKGQTIHQLAARKATQDLEEGRGRIFDAKDQNGKFISERYPSSFEDIVKREAVRLGEQFQVVNKWCSFVAVAANDKQIPVAKAAQEAAKASTHPGLPARMSYAAPAPGTSPISPAYSPSGVDALQDFDFDSFLHEDDQAVLVDHMFSNAIPPPPPTQSIGSQNTNHALQDYQMQHMLLEQQNKNRLQMHRTTAQGRVMGQLGQQGARGGVAGMRGGRGGGFGMATQSMNAGRKYSGESQQGALPQMAMAPQVPQPMALQQQQQQQQHQQQSSLPQMAWGGIPAGGAPSAVPTGPPVQSFWNRTTNNRSGALQSHGSPSSLPAAKKAKRAEKMFSTNVSASYASNDQQPASSSAPVNWTLASPTEKVHALLALQNFDGSWSAEKVGEISEILGKEVGGSPVGGDLGTWVTAVVVVFLERKMKDEVSVWGLVGEKGRGWLGWEEEGEGGKLEVEAGGWVDALA
ncbi:vWA-like protein [Glarea lozoyensis ATCC 20868]|uniref:VWA-like protein n=1 Tax=Glarea lozoyensis (strain ATCC 20868 / MF5171) TaxID=1116229 RepID=S3CZK9_GLAL2|nr:vWA-like protein [Glarea lozoyensis ATCC 20868]EPE30314.1 vWA-like protein [Glarea lozoyensis ATCC 20868]